MLVTMPRSINKGKCHLLYTVVIELEVSHEVLPILIIKCFPLLNPHNF